MLKRSAAFTRRGLNSMNIITEDFTMLYNGKCGLLTIAITIDVYIVIYEYSLRLNDFTVKISNTAESFTCHMQV